MMKRAVRPALVASIGILLASLAQARAEDTIHRDWLKKDMENLQVLSQLAPIEHKSEAEIVRLIRKEVDLSPELLGFGARRVQFGAPAGYTSLNLSILYFQGDVARYTLSVSTSSNSWHRIRGEIKDAWKKNGGPEFRESERGLIHERVFEEVILKYKTAVAAALGTPHSVDVPRLLREDYEYLMSPFQNSMVGFGGCGYAGVDPLGLTSIKKLVANGRIELVENVLRGYNPGGRVYAALELRKLHQSGVEIDIATVNKVLDLDIVIETCSGCIVSHRKARDIVAQEK